jgi:hypothetical protein
LKLNSSLITWFFSENEFLKPDCVSSVRELTNPVVLGFQVERILLATITMNGLRGVTPSVATRFSRNASLPALFRASIGENVLYIPEAWNYPRIDAVLVALVKSTGQKRQKTMVLRVQFIQITVGVVDSSKLAKTRSVLAVNSPERALWSQAASLGHNVDFSLHWIVSQSQVQSVQTSVGYNQTAELVSSLGSVNPDLGDL